jgi:hypothetical protein
LWSRNGKDFTEKFPDIQAALAAQLSVECVLDGELVVWNGGRLDFDALQQRNADTAATVRRRLVPTMPASFVVFDVLAVDRVDIRMMRWSVRRQRLEMLAKAWWPPLQLPPATADVDEPQEWLEACAPAAVEGLVVKGALYSVCGQPRLDQGEFCWGAAGSVRWHGGCCAWSARCAAWCRRARQVLRTGDSSRLLLRRSRTDARSGDHAEQIAVRVGEDNEICVGWVLPLDRPGAECDEPFHFRLQIRAGPVDPKI